MAPAKSSRTQPAASSAPGKGKAAGAKAGAPGFTREEQLDAYRKMLLIRRFEEKAGQLYGMGHIGGFCHLYIGQEAVVVGMQMALEPGDQVITAYRDHGHTLATGMEPKRVMAELAGRRGGCSKGKGGSMHMFSIEKGFYGGDVIALQYRRPGFLISREVVETFERHPKAKALLLEKHGTICWGATVKEAYLSTMDLISRAEEAIAHRAKGRARFGGAAVAAASPEERRRIALAVAPALRGLVGQERRGVMAFDDAPDVLEFACSNEAAALSTIGPATPDHTLYTKRLPCFATVDDPGNPAAVTAAIKVSVNRFVADYTSYFNAHNTAGAALTDAFPRVIMVAGLGMFTTGKDRRTAGIVNDIYHHTISVLGAATSFGTYVSLTAKDAFDVEYWPLELYKLSQAPPEKELARRIALVTGGASGIGRAVALRLGREGAHVVVADLDAAGALKVADEVVAAVGVGRGIGLGMDVASEASVRAGFEEAVLAYGGLDIVVSNAGIAHSSPVDQMTLADWERSFAVNSTGHFLVAREGMRVLKAQGLGGAFVFVATKNVMSPGKDFAAYSAAKAAEAQLAKVLALEGGPHGIRSNIVNPDAVFRDSKLWSEEVRRERARAQGITVEQLEDFYRKRNILAVPILPDDVAEAVLFLASDRSAKTTGCTITVDGGVKDAFPR